MLVSVIITTFGASDFLSRAIRSVQNQTFTNTEIIVVDDNDPNSEGRKKTEEMMVPFLKDSRVKYIKHKNNQNGSAARNTGISVAAGDFIVFLDDDDLYFPDYIKKALDILVSNKECDGVCFSVARLFKDTIVHIQYYDKGHFISIKDILIGGAIGTGSNIFLRREVFEKVGTFDVSFNRKQDLEFMLRVVKSANIIYDDLVLVVKDISNVRRINYVNNSNALELFNEKFSDEILLLSDQERLQYYIKQYSFLLQIAYDSANKQYILESIENLAKYDSNFPKSLNLVKLVKAKILSSFKYEWGSKLYTILRYVKNLYSLKHNDDMILHTINGEIKEIIKSVG